MHFFIFIILICLFIFLYCVYLLANDDFIFLRRDVTMERLFNLIFIGALFSLFSSRLFYGFLHSKSIFANPFVFMLFPYYPGLSLLGAILGGGLFLGFLKSRPKNTLPIGRIGDFFSIVLSITLSIGFLGNFLLSENNNFSATKAIALAITYLILFVIFLRLLFPQLLSGKFKEGTISFLFLISFSIVNLVSNAFLKMTTLNYFKNFENIIFVLILIFSTSLIVRQENLVSKIKELKTKNK